jgi:hypothetical protein
MKLYLHKACFDGVASAAVAAWMLEQLGKEKPQAIEPVDYDVGRSWPKTPLEPRACVVDFLYHPGATYWWDHHETSFLDAKLQRHYERRRTAYVRWDPAAPSCAGLIAASARRLGAELPAHLAETVRWADKLDSASYDSVEEAVGNASAARQIALSFHIEDSAEYHRLLIDALRQMTLDEIVKRAPFRSRAAEALRRYWKGLKLMRQNSRLERDIVLYDVSLHSEIVDRMMPFYLFPQAKYSLGIWRRPEQTKVTSNASPWQKRSGPNLGKIFARYGGGGHRDVASVILPKHGALAAEKLLGEIAAAIRPVRTKAVGAASARRA